MMDWSLGGYEHTAGGIEPVASHVVARCAVGPGDRVLDVACGTGNAALLAAAAGATVTGVDLAPRLVDLARERAAAAGVEAEWLVGDAQELPVDDAGYDLALSIFGAIFAPDADAVARELVRVVRPGGRIVLTSWVDAGPIYAAGRIIREAMDSVAPPDPEPQPQPTTYWGNATWAIDLLLRAGAGGVEVSEETNAFTGASPDAWLAHYAQHHPPYIATIELLEAAGTWPATRERALETLRAANEDPTAFRVTSPYLLITATTASG